jgi:hypothetical protein
MKGLLAYSNVQKAKLLFDFFPSEIADFVTFAQEVAEKIGKEKDQLKASANESQVFPAAYWVQLAESSLKKIKHPDSKVTKSSQAFSEELFTGDSAFFSKHCLLLFSTSNRSKNGRFRQCVDLFFQEGG